MTETIHDKPNFYTAFRKGCKCRPCKDFKARYMRGYRKRLKESESNKIFPDPGEMDMGSANLSMGGGE